ncbi:MAG: hypothetical protein HZA95_02985 [Candidatus Vogelbacteria bacterium]|nr:hypothetical protein [Candidatus Vogelbacteria bacterium]
MFNFTRVVGELRQKLKDEFMCAKCIRLEGYWCTKHQEVTTGYVGIGNACAKCVDELAEEAFAEQAFAIDDIAHELPERERLRVQKHLGRRGTPANAIQTYIARRAASTGVSIEGLLKHVLVTKSADAILPLGCEVPKKQPVATLRLLPE